MLSFFIKSAMEKTKKTLWSIYQLLVKNYWIIPKYKENAGIDKLFAKSSFNNYRETRGNWSFLEFLFSLVIVLT